ncbi:MAG TPA: hypothetical protein VEC36_14145 [Patescibacteria group bacterium]|nr:hypothetical protein [Patescibacteria group bacterium]
MQLNFTNTTTILLLKTMRLTLASYNPVIDRKHMLRSQEGFCLKQR